MVEKTSCSDDVRDLLRLLGLWGRALALLLNTSSGQIFKWVDGTVTPTGPAIGAVAVLADAVRSASDAEREELRALALATPSQDGEAFAAVLSSAVGRKWARDAHVQTAPVQPARGRLVIFRARKNREILAGPGLSRSVSLCAEGGRRARRLAGPLTRRIG